MSDLKKQLIKLGSTNPELRPHIRAVLSSTHKTAGASEFWVFMRGTDAKRLFREAQEDAAHEARADWDEDEEGEYEGGYTGTIAEKPGFVIKGQAETVRAAEEMANDLMDRNDKWGPAFAIEVTGTTKGFFFFGLASS